MTSARSLGVCHRLLRVTGSDTTVLAELARREAMQEALATTTPPKSLQNRARLASQDA
jgi:hypothetical protein